MKETAKPPMSISAKDHDVSDLDLISNLDFGDDDEDMKTTASASGTIKQQAMSIEKATKRTQLLAFLVVLMGAAVGSAFLYLGITNARDEKSDLFERHAGDLATEIDVAWRDYERAALWIHQSCQDWRTPGNTHCSREGFEILSHYLKEGTGLVFEGALWVPNITHAERPAIEANTTWGTKGVNYTGFMGQEINPDTGKLEYGPRSEQPFYFPLHVSCLKDRAAASLNCNLQSSCNASFVSAQFAEPSEGSPVADYDLYSAPWEQPAIQQALDTWEPAMTGRFQLVAHDETFGDR